MTLFCYFCATAASPAPAPAQANKIKYTNGNEKPNTRQIWKITKKKLKLN